MKKIFQKAMILTMTMSIVGGSIMTKMVFANEEAPEEQMVTIENKNQLFSEFEGKLILDNEINGVIRIEDEGGMQIDFIIDEKTVITDMDGIISVDSIAENDEIKVYYVMPQMVTMQYPMKVTASVVVKKAPEFAGDIFVGMLDENYLATDGSLQVHVSEDSDVQDSDGNIYKQAVPGKVVLVYYTMQTMSIPPQTSPNKVVILEQMKTELETNDLFIQEKPQDYIDSSNIPKMPFFVNGQYLEDAHAYTNRSITMIPLRAVCEELGYEVTWNSETQSVYIGKNGKVISLKIDAKEYYMNDAEEMMEEVYVSEALEEMDAVPEITEGKTYVPLSFLTNVLRVDVRIDEGVFNIIAPLE